MDPSYITIPLVPKVEYVTLEAALLKAAEEVELDASVEDVCPLQGSPEEPRVYHHTDVLLRRRLLPAMTICVNKQGEIDHFAIMKDGFATEKTIDKYVRAVMRNLSEQRRAPSDNSANVLHFRR
jgi:hypothetical protein